MRKRVFLKSPARENRTPGSVRGPPGNWRSYRDAVATRAVFIGGVGVGLVRRTWLGASSEAAIEELWKQLPKAPGPRLIVVDAGIATKERLAEADEQNAMRR